MRSIDASEYPGLLFTYPPGGPLRVPRNMWGYEPAGTQVGVEMRRDKEAGPPVGDAWEFASLNDAARFFAGVGLPPWTDHHWIVIDSTRTILLGYSFTMDIEARYGPYGRWVGVEAGFRALEQHHDPMEVAVLETMARETNGGSYAPQERNHID